MNKLILLIASVLIFGGASAQTTLTEAVDFSVKTIYGENIALFPILDDENKIVVIDFFSTTCGPCQEYAPDFQACYEKFGYNEGNVYFLGINWGNNNSGVIEFDSIYGLTLPTASGTQGGGNIIYGEYDILSYPTVIVIMPDHSIVEQYIWYPSEEFITDAVIAAGGTLVNTNEISYEEVDLKIFPNPVRGFGTIEIDLPSTTNIYFTIFNLLGCEVFKSELARYEKGKVHIPFSANELENGYYFVRIESDKEIITTTRFSVVK